MAVTAVMKMRVVKAVIGVMASKDGHAMMALIAARYLFGASFYEMVIIALMIYADCNNCNGPSGFYSHNSCNGCNDIMNVIAIMSVMPVIFVMPGLAVWTCLKGLDILP